MSSSTLDFFTEFDPEAAEALAELVTRVTGADARRTQELLDAGDLEGFYREIGLTRDAISQLYTDIKRLRDLPIQDLILDPRTSLGAIEGLLKTRPPSILLKKVVDLQRDRVEALADIEKGDERLKGHFPNDPVVPGMVQLEALAQASSVGLLAEAESDSVRPLCAALVNVDFLTTVTPGEAMTLKAELQPLGNDKNGNGTRTNEYGSYDRATAAVVVDHRKVSRAEFTFHTDEDQGTSGDRSIPLPTQVEAQLRKCIGEYSPPNYRDAARQSLSYERLKKLLPNKWPFIYLDNVSSFVAGEWAVGEWELKGTEWFFAGQVSREPVMPGVLVLEALGQNSAAALVSRPGNEDKLVLCRAVPGARFHERIVAGDKLRLESTLTRLRKSPFYRARIRAFRDSALAVDATMILVVWPKPAPARLKEPPA